MEQYEIAPKSHVEVLQKIIAKYKPEAILIRFVGSVGGGVVVSEDLSNKKLELEKVKNGIEVHIDGKMRFFYENLKERLNSGRAWSLGYIRINGKGIRQYASAGYPNPQAPGISGPDDSQLSPIHETVLRSVNDMYFIEITISGKVPVRDTGREVIDSISWWHYWEPVLE